MCSPLNHVILDMNFEQLMYSQEYYLSQDYSMGHGRPTVQLQLMTTLMSQRCPPSKLRSPRNVLQRPQRMIPKSRKKMDNDERDRVVQRSPSLVRSLDAFFLQKYKGLKKSKTSETTSGSTPGGINLNDKADESDETQE
ncbi:hypothetical protein Tco_1578329 [Tanacetum coccineum]